MKYIYITDQEGELLPGVDMIKPFEVNTLYRLYKARKWTGAWGV